MAGALTLFLKIAEKWEGIGYYLSHWNSDLFSIGCLAVIILFLSGYFYGCVFKRFIEPLENTDGTLFGVLFILAVFQILIFFLVHTDGSTAIAYYALAIILCISPLLCLVTWSNVIPSWKNLGSLVLGIIVSALLVYGSMNLNTNNIYFDSITYLSEVIESSQNEIFAHMVYPGGYLLQRIDPLHDFTGYYYFWGIILRWMKNLFDLDGILTPIYIWGGTVFYGMLLGNLVINSACVLFKKQAWLGVIFTFAFIAPYYSNYFNTTLAFFGNTVRTVIIGACVLLAYLIIRNTKNSLLFVPLAFCYYAALNVSSSSFFLIAFITAGLFFSLAFAKEKNWVRWAGFIGSLLPLIRMALLVVLGVSKPYWLVLLISIVIVGILVLVAYLLRNNLLLVDKVFIILLPVVFVGLVVLSLVLPNGGYTYGYFFRSSSLDDMTVNMTSHLSTMELIRNIIFYLLFILLLVNFKTERKFKLFLIFIILLFINPLVEPFIAGHLTAGVYSRSFDILNNPFTLCFLLFNLDKLIPMKAVSIAVMTVIGLFSLKFGFDTLTTPYSKSLEVGTDDWNWEAKVSNDSYAVYEFINRSFATTAFDIKERTYDNRTWFLSQDSGLKGYVPGIQVEFTTEDYRSALAGDSEKSIAEDMIVLMYPDRKYTEDDFGEAGDYSKLGELFIKSDVDYVVLNNTLATWDDRGWFVKPYQLLIDKGLCQNVFENETWVVLRINKDWQAAKKHTDRYWVHMYETSQ